MDETLSSLTPEKGGNEKPTTDCASDKQDNKPKENLPRPRRKRARKYAGLTAVEWSGFLVIAMLVPWVWKEFINSHDFKENLLLCCALLLTYAALGYGLAQMLKSSRLAFILWIAASIATCAFGYRNSLPIEWQPPQLPLGCKGVSLDFGMRYGLDVRKLAQFAMIADSDLTKVYVQVKNNSVHVYAKCSCAVLHPHPALRDEGHELSVPITIIDFEAFGLPQIWSQNHNDRAFEIVDQDKTPIFQIYYEAANNVTVNGIFGHDARHLKIVPDGTFTGDMGPGLTRIFNYDPGVPQGVLAK